MALALGSLVTCSETGQPFTIARDGLTFNYATTRDGSILSDAGVDIRERRELLNRSRPFACYLSSDGRHVTGWKGNILGVVTYESESRTGFHRSAITHIRVTDCHGAQWHGKGSGRDMCIRLHASR